MNIGRKMYIQFLAEQMEFIQKKMEVNNEHKNIGQY